MDALKGKTMLLVVLLACAFLSEGVQGRSIDFRNLPNYSCAGRGDHKENCKPKKVVVNPYKRECRQSDGCRTG